MSVPLYGLNLCTRYGTERHERRKNLPARFFELESGRVPVREWLLSLSAEDRKAVCNDIRTAEFGWPIGMPLCRSLSGRKGLWEIRTCLRGGRVARVLFYLFGGNMVLLHGFIKKSQRTPEREIEAAARSNERFGMTHENEVEKGVAGQLFEDLLKEHGTYEDTTEVAVKRVLAFQLAAAMKEQNVSKVEMARRLKTSRSQLDRLLDPDNDTVTLATLARAARAVGRHLNVELV